MLLRRLPCWMTLALGMYCSHCLAQDAFLSLRPQVSLDRLDIRLGDVAEISARDRSVGERLRTFRIARLPSLAKPARYSRAEIDDLLASSGQAPAGGVAWGGSNDTTISGRPQRVDLSPGVDAVAGLLIDKFGPSTKVAMWVADREMAVSVPPGQVRMRPEMGQLHRFGANVEVPITVEVDGVPAASPVVHFVVAGVSPKTARLPDPAPPKTAEASAPPDAEPNKRHEPNAAPDTRAMASTPTAPASALVIEKGHPVRILMDVGAVRIESEGVALADARLGDLVKVKRATGAGEFLGRARDGGLVLVEGN